MYKSMGCAVMLCVAAAGAFAQPNFAMKFHMQGRNEGHSMFLWSNDRCKIWNVPFKLPLFGRKGILARTDYLVDGPHEMMAFLASTKDTGKEGWPFCARTTDGGAWDLGYARTVQRPDGKIVTVYYFNDPSRPERYIGATIWDPGAK